MHHKYNYMQIYLCIIVFVFVYICRYFTKILVTLCLFRPSTTPPQDGDLPLVRAEHLVGAGGPGAGPRRSPGR